VGTIQRFEEIEAWQTARELTRRIYEVSGRGAFSRDYGLRDQMRRAAVSILSNIAEGFESGTQPLFIRYLRYAKASAGEVRAQLYVGLDAGYLTDAEFEGLGDLADKGSRQLSRFISYLESHSAKPSARETASVYQIEEGDERSHV
jgi:four helix bundle protein